jgi:broad specificity phosphatase PhoE
MPPGGKPYWGPHCLPAPPDGSLLIVRHSERDPVRTVAEAYSARLTETGRAMARAFGVQLGRRFQIGAVVASPVERCLETGQEILNGALNGSQPHPPNRDPLRCGGITKRNPEVRPLAVLHFELKQTGIPGLETIFLDDLGFNHLISHPESSEYVLLRRMLLETLPFPHAPGVVNLAVTHDVLITFLQASLLGLSAASIEDFPDYLEGICLVKHNNEVRLF